MMRENRIEGIEVVDTKSEAPRFFAGYKGQFVTATAIVLSSFKNHMLFTTLLFGLPGTGKSVFPFYVAKMLRESAKPIRLIRISCPILLGQRREVADIAKGFESFLHQDIGKPTILFFDEIDAVSSFRTSVASSSVHVITRLLDHTRRLVDKREALVTVFLSASYPNQIDEAILGRVNYVIYFPPAGIEEIDAILAHYGVPEPERVAEALTIKLGGWPLSGRGLVSACESIERLRLNYGQNAWDNADLIMANAVLLQKADSVKKYEAENKNFIESNERTRSFWLQQPGSTV